MLKVGLAETAKGWKQLWNRTREGRELRAVLISFPAGLLAAMLTLPGGMRPLGMALPMALPGSCALASLAGAVIGYSIHGVFADNLSCLAVLACTLGVKLLTDGIPRLRSSPIFLSACAILLGGLVAGIRCTLVSAATGEWIFGMAEAVLTGGATYFAFFGSRFLLSGRRLSEAGMIQRTSILLLALAALMGLTGMELYIFSPGRIIACIGITFPITQRAEFFQSAILPNKIPARSARALTRITPHKSASCSFIPNKSVK